MLDRRCSKSEFGTVGEGGKRYACGPHGEVAPYSAANFYGYTDAGLPIWENGCGGFFVGCAKHCAPRPTESQINQAQRNATVKPTITKTSPKENTNMPCEYERGQVKAAEKQLKAARKAAKEARENHKECRKTAAKLARQTAENRKAARDALLTVVNNPDNYDARGVVEAARTLLGENPTTQE